MGPIAAETHSGLRQESAYDADRRTATWDIRNAPSTYLSLLVTQGVASFFAFAAVWLLTNELGAMGYGFIVAVIASSQIAQVLVNWTAYSVVRFGTQEYVKTGMIARVFWIRMAVLLPKLFFVLITSALWFPPLARWLELPPETFFLMALHLIASALWIHVQMAFQSVKKQRLQGRLLAVERLGLFLAMLALLGLGQLRPVTAALVYGMLPLVMAIVGLRYLSAYILWRFSFSSDFLRKLVRYSVPLLPFTLIGLFSTNYVDVVFVSNLLSRYELGVYSVITLINGLVLQIPTLANAILVPLFVTLGTENKSADIARYLDRILPNLVFVWAILSTLAAFVFHFAVPVVFGDEFRAGQAPLWVLLAASTVALPVLIGYSALSNSTSTTYISMFAATSSAVANVGANFLLIPHYGMVGCSWATLIAFSFSFSTFAYFLRRAVHLPLSWTFIATLPSVAAAVAFTSTGSPTGSLATGLLVSAIIAYFHLDSLKSTLSFFTNYARAL